jgi:drug/metabolite transporter (DMT)-like permease
MLMVVMLLWAGNSIVGRAVRAEIPPFTLACVRWLGALVVLVPFAWRNVVRERAAIAKGWLPLMFLGLLGVAAFNAFLYSGLRHTTASNGLLMQATIPPLVLLLGRALFQDEVKLGQALGVLFSTLGVGVIVFRADGAALSQFRIGRGDLLILGGCLAWAIYTVCLRLRPAVSPPTFLAVTFFLGVMAMAPLTAWEWSTGARVAWNPGTIMAFAYVAVFPSVVAYFLYNAAVAQIGSGAAGQTISLMPLFGALLAVMLLAEPLKPFHAVAIPLILGGVMVAGLSSVRAARAQFARRPR